MSRPEFFKGKGLLNLLNGEAFPHKPANTDDNACLNMYGQDAYFDVRIFHPNALSYHSMDIITDMK